MKRIILTLAAAIAAILIILPVSAAKPGGFSLLGYKWQPAPVHMTVYDNSTSPIYQQAVRDSVAMWNVSPYVEMTIVASECRQYTRGAIAVCEKPVCSYNYAALEVNRDRILSATVFLNDGCNDFSLPYEVFLKSVCQEVGHSLGLDHSADPESCLGSGVGVSVGDLADLQALYGRN